MEAQVEPITTMKPKWSRELLISICVVLEEFDDIFPQELPLGLPLVR